MAINIPNQARADEIWGQGLGQGSEIMDRILGRRQAQQQIGQADQQLNQAQQRIQLEKMAEGRAQQLLPYQKRTYDYNMLDADKKALENSIEYKAMLKYYKPDGTKRESAPVYLPEHSSGLTQALAQPTAAIQQPGQRINPLQNVAELQSLLNDPNTPAESKAMIQRFLSGQAGEQRGMNVPGMPAPIYPSPQMNGMNIPGLPSMNPQGMNIPGMPQAPTPAQQLAMQRTMLPQMMGERPQPQQPPPMAAAAQPGQIPSIPQQVQQQPAPQATGQNGALGSNYAQRGETVQSQGVESKQYLNDIKPPKSKLHLPTKQLPRGLVELEYPDGTKTTRPMSDVELNNAGVVAQTPEQKLADKIAFEKEKAKLKSEENDKAEQRAIDKAHAIEEDKRKQKVMADMVDTGKLINKYSQHGEAISELYDTGKFHTGIGTWGATKARNAPEHVGIFTENAMPLVGQLATELSSRGGAVVSGMAMQSKPDLSQSDQYNKEILGQLHKQTYRAYKEAKQTYEEASGGKEYPIKLSKFYDKWKVQAPHGAVVIKTKEEAERLAAKYPDAKILGNIYE